MRKSKLQVKIKKWDFVPILEYCYFERGTEPGSRFYNTDEVGSPFIRVGNIAAQIQKQIYTTSENIKLCKKDDILIALDGSPGIVIRGIEGAYSSGIRKVILKDSKNVFYDFIYYILQAKFVQNTIKEYSTGVTIKHASKSLEHIKVPFPPLPVQQKIVYVLDSIQDAVGVQEIIIERTKELKKSLMHKLFREGTKEKSKIKNQKSKLQFKIQKWVKLKEAAEIIMGQSPPSSSYNESMEGLPFLQGKAEFGETSPIPIKWCSEPIKIAQKGDVLISVRAPVGDVNLADQKYCIGRGLAAIHPKENFDNIYLFNYFQISKEKIENESTGSTFRAVGKNVLENFLIPLLSLSEQREIAEIFQAVDQKIEIEQKKKALYEELFGVMLNKLMNREIKVDNLNLKYAAKNRKKIS